MCHVLGPGSEHVLDSYWFLRRAHKKLPRLRKDNSCLLHIFFSKIFLKGFFIFAVRAFLFHRHDSWHGSNDGFEASQGKLHVSRMFFSAGDIVKTRSLIMYRCLIPSP